jgi:uncharacterized protein (TIGR02145 family)
MERTLWNYLLILIVIITGELIFLTSCKKDENKPKIKYGKVADFDGNNYRTVTIGKQVWMAENLKVTHYLNGDIIGTTTLATLDISNDSTPKFQWAYDGKETNVDTYGRLYTFYSITDNRNICPTGWHVPSDEEWYTLEFYLEQDSSWFVGGKLKETGTTHWANPNNGATNKSGFTGLPGGRRLNNGVFQDIDSAGYWWTSTEYTGLYAWSRALYYYDDHLGGEYDFHVNTRFGLSVRCVKD